MAIGFSSQVTHVQATRAGFGIARKSFEPICIDLCGFPVGSLWQMSVALAPKEVWYRKGTSRPTLWGPGMGLSFSRAPLLGCFKGKPKGGQREATRLGDPQNTTNRVQRVGLKGPGPSFAQKRLPSACDHCHERFVSWAFDGTPKACHRVWSFLYSTQTTGQCYQGIGSWGSLLFGRKGETRGGCLGRKVSDRGLCRRADLSGTRFFVPLVERHTWSPTETPLDECFPALMWPWVISYASILGRMNTHVTTYFDVHQGYRALTHNHVMITALACHGRVSLRFAL